MRIGRPSFSQYAWINHKSQLFTIHLFVPIPFLLDFLCVLPVHRFFLNFLPIFVPVIRPLAAHMKSKSLCAME